MPNNEELQLLREDPHSNYYAFAFNMKKSGFLPLNTSFPRYSDTYGIFNAVRDNKVGQIAVDSYQLLMSMTFAIPEVNEHIFDALCRTAQNRDDKDLCRCLAVNSGLLERFHDYIQAWFPINRQSEAHLSITLSDYDRQMIQANSELQKTVLYHFVMMMAFYKFSLTVGNYQGNPADHQVQVGVPARVDRLWLTPGNHNFLRITRILNSLNLLGLNNYVQAFKAALDTVDQQHPRIISDETKDYWDRAARPCPEIARYESPAIDDQIVRDTWSNVIREIKNYFYILEKPSFIESLFNKGRRTAKREAIFNLTKTLTGLEDVYLNGAPDGSDVDEYYQQMANTTDVVVLKERLCVAGAVARGYISGFPGVTAAFNHSRLYDLLETIVQKQRECVAGNLTPVSNATVRNNGPARS